MKLGPVHVVTDRTMDAMQAQTRQLATRLSATLARLDQLQAERDRLLTAVAPREHEGLPRPHRHHTNRTRPAPVYLLEPDADAPASRAAVARIVAAYQQAREDFVAAQPCMWEHIAQQRGEFLEALNLGDTERVGSLLRQLFRTDLVWGLGIGMGHAVPDTLGAGRENAVQVLLADQLRSLAESVGTARLTSHEQNLDEHLHALDVDLDDLFARTEAALGRSLTAPDVGGSYGCTLAGRRTTPDYVYHAYTFERLRRIGAAPTDSVAEIGGGYGCLALQFARAGFADYTIYDLPWVNAIQGYYLLASLPPERVRLYGEPKTGPAVTLMPGWCFEQLPARSTDWVVNVNSMPEMGRATACGYLRAIGRVLRRRFLSINQEARTPVLEYGPQNCVPELVAEIGGLRRIERTVYWMRNGYAEEVYEPA